MPTGVQLQFQKQCDHLAAYKKAIVVAISGRGSLWQMVHDANDQTYDNRVEGTSITSVDVLLNAASYGKTIPDWFSRHRDYFTIDLGLSGIDAGITSYGWRVDQYFNQMFQEWGGSYLPTTNVFPQPGLVFGTYAVTGTAFTAGVTVNATQASGAKVLAQPNATIGASSLTVTATLTRAAGASPASKALPVTFSASSATSVTQVFGETFLGTDAAAAQAVLLMASTSAFTVGDLVLVESTANQEVATVLSISAGVSITLAANLKNAYPTASGSKVTPLFYGVSAASSTGGTAGDAVSLKNAVDRTTSLVYP